MKLEVGQRVPEFELKDQDGNIRKLSDYKGRFILLYFYPRDFTPGCTTEACEFRDAFSELKKYIEILGVSKDTVEKHKKFEVKYSLPFTLLSDQDEHLAKLYGTDGLLFNKRTSFLIGPDGKIVKIYENVKPDEHSKEVLKDITLLTN